MAVILTTPQSEIDDEWNAFEQYVRKQTIRVLSYIGEMCVKEARDRAQEQSWFDQTGNLRTSIGYVVYHDGVKVSSSNFETVKNGEDGREKGQSLASEIASQNPSGWLLVVVAGMHYASLVEGHENKNVLASSYGLAQTVMPKMMRDLETQIYKRIA